MKEALDEADLDQVAGGELYECDSTYRLEGEWCWFSDSCDIVVLSYDDEKKREADAWVDQMAADTAKKILDFEANCVSTAACSSSAAWDFADSLEI